jgi:hypothetical protein
MFGAFEFDGAPAERRGQAEVSHPHGGQRRRVAANGDVDAEPGIAQRERSAATNTMRSTRATRKGCQSREQEETDGSNVSSAFRL